MKNNYKFIIIGLLIGIIYSVVITNIYENKISNNPFFKTVKINNIIDDRNNIEINNVIEYEDEVIIYLDNETEFYHKLFQKQLHFLVLFIIIVFVLSDIVLFPEERKSEGILDFLKLKNMNSFKRKIYRNKINNLLLGLFLSTIPILIIQYIFK
jgi:hypothetical protein